MIRNLPYRRIGFFILDMIIIYIFVWALFMAWHSWDKQYITYNTSEQTWSDSNKTLAMFHLSYNVTGEVFSAHPKNPIIINATAFMDYNFTKKFPKIALSITNLYVYLPTSAPYLNQKFDKGHILSDVITLTRYTSNNPMEKPAFNDLFKGSVQVLYENEGKKCTYVSLTSIPDTPDECTSIAHTIIQIAPPDSYFQLQNTKITNALTYVLVAFTVLSIRVFFKDVIDNIRNMIKDILSKIIPKTKT